MSFESVVYNTLKNDGTLQGLCSQIFPQQPVDNISFPFCWYNFTKRDSLTLIGVATGISNYTFEVNIFSQYQNQNNNIAAQIRVLLDGLKSHPDIGMCVLDAEANKQRSDGYIYFVTSQLYKGIGV